MKKFEAAKRVLKIVWKTTKICFVVFCVYLLSLFFREENLPAWLMAKIETSLDGNLSLAVDSGSFGFRRGLTLRGVRVYDKTRTNSLDAVFSLARITVSLRMNRIELDGVRYPRLPDWYYGLAPKPPPSKVEIPEWATGSGIEVDVVNSEILGVAFSHLTARADLTSGGVEIGDIHLTWPDSQPVAGVSGKCSFDFKGGSASGEVRGAALQSQIRPMLVVLDQYWAVRYTDAFTAVEGSVPAGCRWSADSSHFDLVVDVAPGACKYNGVAIRRVSGEIAVALRHPPLAPAYEWSTSIRNVDALDLASRPLAGTMTISGGAARKTVLDFDARSDFRQQDLVDVVEYIGHDTFDFVECLEPPSVTAVGRIGTGADEMASNDLTGTVRCAKFKMRDVVFSDCAFDYSFRNDVCKLEDLSMRSESGGELDGDVRLTLPGYDASKGDFSLNLSCRGVTISEVADFFGVKEGEMSGHVTGMVYLSAPLGTNFLAGLGGSGHIESKDGCLAKIKLFMGLTKLLSDHVPGVSSIVEQSQGSCDFTIRDGVVSSDNVYIEGSLFSIKAWGSYDIVRDDIDFTLRVQFLKRDSFVGKVFHSITFPFTKLLLEYRLHGKVSEPKWEYISIVDRVK